MTSELIILISNQLVDYKKCFQLIPISLSIKFCFVIKLKTFKSISSNCKLITVWALRSWNSDC